MCLISGICGGFFNYITTECAWRKLITGPFINPADFQHCQYSTKSAVQLVQWWWWFWFWVSCALPPFRDSCGEGAHAVWSPPAAAAQWELLHPAPGGIHHGLQPQHPDASVELLHHQQASKCVSTEERTLKAHAFHTRIVQMFYIWFL